MYINISDIFIYVHVRNYGDQYFKPCAKRTVKDGTYSFSGPRPTVAVQYLTRSRSSGQVSKVPVGSKPLQYLDIECKVSQGGKGDQEEEEEQKDDEDEHGGQGEDEHVEKKLELRAKSSRKQVRPLRLTTQVSMFFYFWFNACPLSVTIVIRK
jgi:hypothetical protein